MNGAVAGRAPRNIILLSDGTGASSLSFNKSNVWRVFTTLDLGPGSDQIAYYDDGVGTSGIKWLRALGGGFGWGLSRNVRQMYEFLCRHYQPGDRIYIFGFSRGAFTARVLAHFIGVCGILDRTKGAPGNPGRRMETDRGLRRGVKQAYKSYRRRYWDRAWWFQQAIAMTFRPIRNLIPGWEVLKAEDFKERYSLPERADGDRLIEFLGVWDTVDAVGLPVDELSDLLDKFVYPYKFPDQKFSQHVERAAHALAIDDERQTFHPVLWDESDTDDAARIEQVWFAGMHSNVGGGYPEDNLGYITLNWMIAEACDNTKRPKVCPLRFNDPKREVFKNRAEPVGKLYNSRRGAAVYYRYKPRYIADLCNQGRKPRNAAELRGYVRIKEPKIHESVLARIADAKAGYAPIGLPPSFSVVHPKRVIASFSDPAFAGEGADNTPTPAQRRLELLERTRNHVFWRRFAYFTLLILTFALVAMPVFEPPIPGWEAPEGWGSWASSGLEFLFEHLVGAIPDFANYWTDAWTQSAGKFLFFLFWLVVIFFWSYWVEGNIRELSEGGLWHLKGNSAPRPIRKIGVFDRIAGWLRPSFIGRGGSALFSRFLVPFVFAVLSLCVIFGGAYRLFIHYPLVKDGVCRLVDEDSLAQSILDARTAGFFSAKDPCFETDIILSEEKRYKVTLTGDSTWNGAMEISRPLSDPLCRRDDDRSSWKDDTFPATFKGLNCIWARFRPTFLAGLSARRHLGYPWFTLVGRIDRDRNVKDGEAFFPMNQSEFVFRPPASGRLSLFVNDAIGIWPFATRWHFYDNNEGKARVVFEGEGKPSGTDQTAPPDMPTIKIVELKD